MQHLLDTHTLIWFINGNEELSAKARKAIETDDAINFVSIATLWEIAIKVSLDKLELKVPFSEIREKMEENSFQLLPINFEDTLTVSTLPFHHRDPFDRIIIAQSIAQELTIISKDKLFADYGVKLLW